MGILARWMDLINEGTFLCLLILCSLSFSIFVSQQGGSLLLDVVNLNRSLVEVLWVTMVLIVGKL